MTAVDESQYPVDRVARVTVTFADGSTVVGAGALIWGQTDEVLTAADLVWKPGVGAATSVVVDPQLNGTHAYGEIAADHYRYFPIASNGAAGDQFDFALLHLATPFIDQQPAPHFGFFPPTPLATFTIPVTGSGSIGYSNTIYGYPAAAGGATIDAVAVPIGLQPVSARSTTTVQWSGRAAPSDPGYVGAADWQTPGEGAPVLAAPAGVETADGLIAELTLPLIQLMNSWMSADHSGAPQPSGAIAIPLLLSKTITPDTGAPGVDPAEARLVDTASYLLNRPDVAEAGVDAAAHFANFGWHELTPPDPLFDVKYYLQHNPDVVAAGIDPLLHYALYGWHEGRDPSAAFSTSAYLATHQDVALAGMDPLEHYLWFGIAENRAVSPGQA